MKITLDKDADAVYIELSDKEFYKNKKVDNETIVDFDAEGKVIGIEILNANKRLSKNFFSNVHFQNVSS